MMKKFILGLIALCLLSVEVAKADLQLNNLDGFGASSNPDATITLTVTGGISSSSSTPTMNINGGVRTGKWIIGFAGSTTGSGAVDPSSLTLNGVSLRKVISNNTGQTHVAVWITDTDVSCDGTDQVVATFSVTMSGSGTGGNGTQLGLYAVGNLLSTTETATSTSDANPSSLNLNVQAGSVVVGATGNGSSTTPSWTGMSASSGDYAKTGGSFRISGQHNSFATAQTPATISVTTGGTGDTASVAATFR